MTKERLAEQKYPIVTSDEIGNNYQIMSNSYQLCRREGFIAGYDAAVEKAVEWLEQWDKYRVCLEGRKEWFVEQFKKAMEE